MGDFGKGPVLKGSGMFPFCTPATISILKTRRTRFSCINQIHVDAFVHIQCMNATYLEYIKLCD